MNGTDVGFRARSSMLVLAAGPIAILAVTNGCSAAISGSAGPRFGADTLSVAGGTSHGSGSESFAVSRKRVAAKEEPATLVADDGSRCRLTEGRFRKVREGDYVTCLWRLDDR